MKKSIWDKAAAIYDEYVTDTSHSFLRNFMKEEQELLDKAITDVARQSSKISLVEVGCGTGRTLFSYATKPHILTKIEYVIGIDNSKAMIDIAKLKKGELVRRRVLTADAPEILFFLMEGEELSQYFCQGKVMMEALRRDFLLKEQLRREFDEKRYAASTKIVCNLLNTLGVVEEDSRAAMVKNMVKALGPKDKIVISVLDANCFVEEAPVLYKTLEPLVGYFNQTAFINELHIFKTDTYYSHWFTKEEVIDLLTQAGCQGISIEHMQVGGHFVTAGVALDAELTRELPC